MRFDDRLTTVLAQVPETAHDQAVRWRQLVELLARSGTATPLVKQALADVRDGAAAVDEQLRAATARAVARPQVSMELVSVFAADTITVAAPVLAAARLNPEEWRSVLDAASPDNRRFIASLHPDLRPGASISPAPAAVQESPAAREARAEHAIPSLSELVARIERLRQEREMPVEPAPAPAHRPQVVETPSAFRWECGPSGEIAWVEGVPRGPLVGRSLAAAGEINGVDDKLTRAFAMRAPFRDAVLTIPGEGLVAGEWKISGLPAFDASAGRFAGYRGVATRADRTAEAPSGELRRHLDHDSIRELVHEIKTPLNAIIGFAEIIDGQYLGPADYHYRERAAEIVAQAHLLLGAIEDLDLAAQLRASPAQARGSTDVSAVVRQMFGSLADRAIQREVTLALEAAPTRAECALNRNLVERLVRRFCETLIDAAAPGQRLELIVSAEAAQCRISLDEPRKEEADERQEQAALPLELSLRLLRALATVAGGSLVSRAGRMVLMMPRLRD